MFNKPRRVWTQREQEHASYSAKNGILGLKERLARLESDPKKEERIKRHWCIWCMYGYGIMAAQAFHTQDCGICGQSQVYNSSDTERLCLACAQEHELCRRCGGDIKMRTRRNKPWATPVPRGEEPKEE